MCKPFEYHRDSHILSSFNYPLASCRSSTVVILQMKTITYRWQRQTGWPQYINSFSCNDLEKNVIDALHRSRKIGNQKPFIHSEAAP